MSKTQLQKTPPPTSSGITQKASTLTISYLDISVDIWTFIEGVVGGWRGVGVAEGTTQKEKQNDWGFGKDRRHAEDSGWRSEQDSYVLSHILTASSSSLLCVLQKQIFCLAWNLAVHVQNGAADLSEAVIIVQTTILMSNSVLESHRWLQEIKKKGWRGGKIAIFLFCCSVFSHGS